MVKWFKSLNKTAKMMIALIILFAIAIATRWDYVKREVAESFQGRFTVEKPHTPGTSAPVQYADSSAVADTVR